MYFLILYLEIVVFQHEYTEFIELSVWKTQSKCYEHRHWSEEQTREIQIRVWRPIISSSWPLPSPPWLQWRSAEQEHREQSPLPATRWRMAADFRITVLRYLSPGGQNPPGAALTWRVTRDIASRTRAHVSNSSEREQENQSWFLERKKIARNTIFGYFKCIYI